MRSLGARRGILSVCALFLAVALLAAACGGGGTSGGGGGGGGGGQQVQNGGTLVFGAEQEPSEGLNFLLVCCTLAWSVWMLESPTLYGAYHHLPDFSYEPQLIDGEAKVTQNPFTITYHIKPQAKWSDGQPVTSKDFIFTWKTFVNPKWQMASRAGYDQIKSAQAIDDKTVKFIFSKPFADWKDLFEPVLPEHVLNGQNFNKVWQNCICDPKTGKGIGDGPFVFQSYQKGNQLTLVKNPNWWGSGPHLDKIVWKFTTDTNTEIQQLRGHEVDAIYPQPQLELKQLQSEPGIKLTTKAGTTYEHIDLQQGPKGNPLLKNLWMRQAIAYGIDRQAIVNQLFKDLSPGLPVLNNVMYLTNQPEYQPHFNIYKHDPKKAEQLLQSHGCKKGSDGIYVCNGQRASFRFVSTSGNELRELTFEIIQQQLKQVGIEVKNDFGDPAVVFGNKVLVAGNYDLFMFAWVGNPDPSGNVEIWKCKGSQNFTGWCNPKATKLLDASQSELNPQKRAQEFNEADQIAAQDLPTIPLYQKPDVLAYNADKVHGMTDNPAADGPAWDAQNWWISR